MKSEKLWIADRCDGTYVNPVLYADYSDPDVIRVGDDYFMISSSFCNVPAIPVLHSKDLVNWKVVNYVLDKLPFADYDVPAHGRGVWAPAIRYHDGMYYVFFPMPDEGIFVSMTEDPFGKWSEPICVKKAVGWIDPCPFWDDDGQVYMVSGFAKSRMGFNNVLRLSRLDADTLEVIDGGRDIYDGNLTGQRTTEGPKLYKRNGYYYIFAPTGGVAEGVQLVLRSRSIWGPYEEKIVLAQGNTPVNGPHQGAWVDTKSGEDWFLHFQDAGNVGRVVHLQPMRWEDDWPVMGINQNREGCGEPVLSYRKPDVGCDCMSCAPVDSDEFDGDTLGLQWQWNANYKKEWYKLDFANSRIELNSMYITGNLNDAGNLLLQKWPAPRFNITTRLDLSRLTDNRDIAGMISLGGIYTGFGVICLEDKKRIVQITGEWQKNNECVHMYEEIDCDEIILKMIVKDDAVSFAYCCVFDNNDKNAYDTDVKWIATGEKIKATPGRWVGVKVGLFCVNREQKTDGVVAAEYFRFHKI
ncbi:MAG: glycosyl hydrolase 43 family protein [Lachnospiraceae bacterium]|nr:glycosyl hydrolase 43 family protein [Lachnospiraceae bacterium]